MKLRGFLLAGALCWIGIASSSTLVGQQGPGWAATFSGPGSEADNPYAIAADASGSVYVTGSYNSGVVPPGKPQDVCGDDDICRDWATLKYSPEGVEVWRAQYAGPGHSTDDAYAIAVDREGCACVAGTASQAEGGKALTVVKYSPEGEELWARSVAVPGRSFQRAVAVLVGAGGSVIAAGVAVRMDPATGLDMLAAVRYAPDGTESWVSFREPVIMQGNAGAPGSLAVDEAGDVYLTGRTGSEHASDNAFLVKYSPSGDELWARTFGSPHASDRPIAVLPDGKGNVCVADASPGGPVTEGLAAVKYDAEGTEVWARSYDGPGSSDGIAEVLAADEEGSLYVAGTGIGASGRRGITTVKYSADGEELWARRLDAGDGSFEAVHTLLVRDDGNVLVAGSAGDFHSAVVYSRGGGVLEEFRLEVPPSFRYFRGALADATGTVYAIGNAVSAEGGVDYITVKLSAPERPFRRGDANDDGKVDIADAIGTLCVLFLGQGVLGCGDAVDANDDGAIDISDAVATLAHLFLGAFEMPAPGPLACGRDPTPDGLGCGSQTSCE